MLDGTAARLINGLRGDPRTASILVGGTFVVMFAVWLCVRCLMRLCRCSLRKGPHGWVFTFHKSLSTDDGAGRPQPRAKRAPAAPVGPWADSADEPAAVRAFRLAYEAKRGAAADGSDEESATVFGGVGLRRAPRDEETDDDEETEEEEEEEVVGESDDESSHLSVPRPKQHWRPAVPVGTSWRGPLGAAAAAAADDDDDGGNGGGGAAAGDDPNLRAFLDSLPQIQF